jgi:hypothetical protein
LPSCHGVQSPGSAYAGRVRRETRQTFPATVQQLRASPFAPLANGRKAPLENPPALAGWDLSFSALRASNWKSQFELPELSSIYIIQLFFIFVNCAFKRAGSGGQRVKNKKIKITPLAIDNLS